EGLAGDAAGDGLRAQAAGDAAAVLRIVGRLRGRGRGGGWLLCHRGQRQRAGQDGNGNGDRRGGAGHRGAPWGNRASSIAWRGVAPCLRGWALGDVHGRGECAGVAWPPGPRTDAHVSTRSLVTACGRCDRDVLRRGRPESLFVCQGARWRSFEVGAAWSWLKP